LAGAGPAAANAILRIPFAMAISVYGLLLLLGGQEADLLGFGAASLAALAWCFPRRDRWEREQAAPRPGAEPGIRRLRASRYPPDPLMLSSRQPHAGDRGGRRPMGDAVLLEVNDRGVMLATLNHPETMNSLSGEMSEGLLAAIRQASVDDGIGALVITGAGRGFCSGANAGAMASRPAGQLPSRHARMDRRGGSMAVVEAMAACDVPIIGAINGPAAGAGFGIALACDVRFMAESARVGTIFIKRGGASDYGVAYWLPRIVGVAKAFELSYSGDLLDSASALRVGLANRVVPDERLLEETMAYAATLAAGPPLAYTALRRMLIRSTDMPMHQFLEYEWTAQLDLLASKDFAEGFRAFIERREPNFKGE
jgi:2-(1,2-epoxy-1,2-dihydrophenyl)acetyl-CoA isomerase